MFLDLLAEQPLFITANMSAAASTGDDSSRSSGHPTAATAPAAVGAAGAAAPAEEWRVFFAFKGELPTAEELASFKGIVITGSV